MAQEMSATEFRAALAQLGLTQKQACLLFGLGKATVIRYAGGTATVPLAVAFTLRLMIRYRLTPNDVTTLPNIGDAP